MSESRTSAAPPDPGVRIRPVRRGDRDWILALVPRLHAFGPPPWRDADVMTAAVARVIAGVLHHTPEDSVLLVAESDQGTPLGFVHIETAIDYFTSERHGHISDIIVAGEREGRGVGRALMAAAEDRGRTRGYRLLTLHVFGENARARALYERLGYAPDTLKYVKELDRAGTGPRVVPLPVAE